MKEMIEVVLGFADSAEEFRPSIQKAFSAISSYGPECYGFFKKICFGTVDLKAAMVERFEKDHGFTRQEAIELTKDQWTSFQQQLAKGSRKN